MKKHTSTHTHTHTHTKKLKESLFTKVNAKDNLKCCVTCVDGLENEWKAQFLLVHKEEQVYLHSQFHELERRRLL